ncbi:HD domain-containing phosphohydrolase [Roseateles toxinivorans]|uniref:Putative two-component system response regulator n=1 Tax=Roseateles toxinivorans TaxID=270368 RepID=A0A4R6QNL5_9BURK|nr:HD domain-containing phosphohydrolase [Roseateles toxinivorans]TDP64071.1 putative two-component system response regulator [Roseateles toxinivorans]
MTQHVLIVDDTQINLVLFEALVKRLGTCQAHTFLSSTEGLVWAQTQDSDLVIVDYMMPDLDGIAFIEQLRATPGRESVPVLMITANDQKDVRYRALNAGATDFLAKPVDRVEFLARVTNLLALSDARRKLSDRAAWLTEEVRKATHEIVQRERETVIRLSKAAEYRDPETGAHILRMAHYAKLIARELGLSEAEQELLLNAAPLHDIGKVGIADHILLKPGRLTVDEFEIMKLHASYGYEILRDSASEILQAGASIALGHHEKFDGSGYPNGLRGEAIPIFSRIVAVADVFDALTSARPYKPAWTVEAALLHLRTQSGTHFDPRCVAAFLALTEEALEIRERFADDDWPSLLAPL